MGEDFLSSPALRLLGRYATGGLNPASGDDLMNLNTSKLPHRALAWAQDTLMQFDREDSTSVAANFGASGEPLVVVPNQGPGRWLALFGDAVDSLSVEQQAGIFTETIVVTGADEWSVMPAAAWAFTGDAPIWVDDAAGVITYNGPLARYQVGMQLSVVNATAANTTDIGLVGSINGANIGLTTDLATEGRTTATLQTPEQVVAQDQISLAPGDTFQPLFRSANGDDFTLLRAHLTFELISIT